MAQDWRGTFGCGGWETTIYVVDPQGVLIAAVQALSRRLRRLEEQHAAQPPCRCADLSGTPPRTHTVKETPVSLTQAVIDLINVLGPVITP